MRSCLIVVAMSTGACLGEASFDLLDSDVEGEAESESEVDSEGEWDISHPDLWNPDLSWCQGPALYRESEITICVVWEEVVDLDIYLKRSDDCDWRSDVANYANPLPDWCEPRGLAGEVCETGIECDFLFEECIGWEEGRCQDVADDPRVLFDAPGDCVGTKAECISLVAPCAGRYHVGVRGYGGQVIAEARVAFFSWESEIVFGEEAPSTWIVPHQFWFAGTLIVSDNAVESIEPRLQFEEAPVCEDNPSRDPPCVTGLCGGGE